MDVINSGIGVVRSIITLQHAFMILDVDHNIHGEQDFTCCSTCGHAEMQRNLEECDHLIGYCFYCGQSAESMLETGEVYLQHGATEDENDDKVARTICDVLEQHEFKVEWEGDTSKAIRVQVIEEFKDDDEEFDEDEE